MRCYGLGDRHARGNVASLRRSRGHEVSSAGSARRVRQGVKSARAPEFLRASGAKYLSRKSSLIAPVETLWTGLGTRANNQPESRSTASFRIDWGESGLKRSPNADALSPSIATRSSVSLAPPAILALMQATAFARLTVMVVPGQGDRITAAMWPAAGQLAGELVWVVGRRHRALPARPLSTRALHQSRRRSTPSLQQFRTSQHHPKLQSRSDRDRQPDAHKRRHHPSGQSRLDRADCPARRSRIQDRRLGTQSIARRLDCGC